MMPSGQLTGSAVERAVTGIDLVGVQRECAVAILHDHVLLLWRTNVVEPGARWTRRGFLEVRKRLPGKRIAFFTVLEKQCDVSTPPVVRKEIAQLLNQYEQQLSGASITLEDEGFKATMVRSIITAINLASRTRFPNAVFNDAAVAAAWLHSYAHDSPVTPATLITAIDQMRTL